jgi:8-oxo-dGTP pyrophosphatase MutT (NUDIX family)
MIDTPSSAALVRSFLDPSDGELLKSRDLILLLLEYTSAPFSRRQFAPGHITCTGLVLSPDGGKLLLVHHRRLDRWLLPGGHVEKEDASLADASHREVIEETGAVLRPERAPAVAGLDVHGIPPRRDEPYHLHHDLIFSWRADSEQLTASAESRDVLWCGPDDFDRYLLPANIRRAWQRVAAM